MLTLMVILQVFLGLILVGLILLQKGKGAEMGVAFGTGAADTLFGPTGAMSFLAKITWGLAFVFMLNSIGISYIIYKSNTSSITTSIPTTTTQTNKTANVPVNPETKPITK
ncbi:preprotein translocase subunit SecG [Hippea maritima]|uniref:Protein-export membrane protein SecG n=1 Tax=Hippea maritima (strain ATCC 700847 / DSM 10411 / MH2) TaxID=760142 RepID=F2LX81_HIPMA|nr:preprotein translocase subunit SecG [Hippea maritima]AEA33139.1 preprotein translocase, SecG subunit [Hippea maritima DSM 10411]